MEKKTRKKWSIEIKENEKSISLFIPLKTQGKYRAKNRTRKTEFGIPVSKAGGVYTEKTYIEWQIGYYVTEETLGKGRKTKLDYFTYDEKGKKYLYELSEIMWFLCKRKFVSKKRIKELVKSISENDFFFSSQYEIKSKKRKQDEICGREVVAYNIQLPSFLFDESSGTDVCTEISIQKQQNGYGFQPMLYAIFPITCFENFNEIKGNKAEKLECGEYILSKNNTERTKIFLDMFFYFGLCSENHKNDVIKILNTIKEKAFN